MISVLVHCVLLVSILTYDLFDVGHSILTFPNKNFIRSMGKIEFQSHFCLLRLK